MPDVRALALARKTAVVAGLLGFVLAVATPLLPVRQTTTHIDWPQTQPTAPITSVIAPLTSYVPIDITMSAPCSAVGQLTGPDATVIASTTPKQADKAVERGLFIRVSGRNTDPPQSRSVEIVDRNVPVLSATLADIASQNCRTIAVQATSTSVVAEFEGMTDDAGAPLRSDTSDKDSDSALSGDQRPEMTGVYSDLTAATSAIPGLSVHATVDSRYSTAPSLVKHIAIWLGMAMTVLALIALHFLDRTDSRAHRRIFPARWWRLNARDLVVIPALIVWHIVGPNTSDDGYLLTMSRVAEHAHYTPNYYRWFGAPEAPFGWYYQVFGWLEHISFASPLVRLPGLLCGVVVWLIISHEVIPRLGRAAITSRAVAWTAAFVFLAAWFPFNNGLRPEAIICLGAVLTWCSVERAIATGRILPAAIACTTAAFSLAAGPTGLLAVAALLAGARPIVGSIIKRSNVIAVDTSLRHRLLAGAAILAPVLAAGTFVIFVVFTDLTLTGFTNASKMKTALGPASHWYNEIDRYSALFNFSADGSVGRRFAVLTLIVALALTGFMLLRKGRIPGTAIGPTQRLVGVTFASLVFLMFTPTKWTHHFGVFAGFAAALAAILAIAMTNTAMATRRNRTIAVAVLLLITALVFTGPNAYYYISNWGMPFGARSVMLGINVGNAILYIALATMLLAGWFHFRDHHGRPPQRHISVSSPIAAIGRGVSSRISVIGGLALVVVIFEMSTAIITGINQSGSYSVSRSNLAAIAGKPCGMADKVWVEPDATAGLLTPVDSSLSDPLAGTGIAGSSESLDVAATSNFTPNGLPMSLASKADQGSLGVLAGTANNSPDALVSSSGGTSGGERSQPGINGSTAKLPFSLNPQRTPVLGSYSQNEQQPARLRTGWYQLPAANPAQPLISVSVAGEFDIKDLTLQYSTDTGTRDTQLKPKGTVDLIDPGPQPAWRNLRIDRAAFPSKATAIRIVATDYNLASDRFIAVTPPRAPRVQTLQSLVGSHDPVQIDWTSGLAFPCQRPFTILDGVAQVPQWRIKPGADLAAAVSAWQNASGGGPLGWIEVALDSNTVGSYLRNDLGRDWGSLERYTPYDKNAAPARLTKGTQTRSGLWSPAPIRY